MAVNPKEHLENSVEPESRWTWEGNEREQFRAFKALPILEKLKVIEEMCEVVEQLSKASSPSKTSTDDGADSFPPTAR